MRRQTRVLVVTGGIALGACAWFAIREARRSVPPSEQTTLEAAAAEVEAGRRTTPLIGEPEPGGGATVTFLAKRADGREPRIVSDVTGWGERLDGTFDFAAGTMARVGRTEWYALRARVAPRARVEYLLAYAPADYRLDPHNRRQAAGPALGGLRASEFVMPGYVSPRAFADPHAAPAGALAESALGSRALRGPCRVVVYTPPGYRPGTEYAVAVMLDARSRQVSRVLDSLIANGEIEPVVAVFVEPHGLGERLKDGVPLPAFLNRDLLGWLRSRYAVTGDARRRAVLGISFGAKDALEAALDRREAFGLLGLLIPGRRIRRADIEAIGGPPSRRLRVAMLAGLYDHANIETARGLRRALAGAGHAVEFLEVPEGHSAVTWASHLGEVLASLFGGRKR
jgi:enterochelin esterase-like enzyme